VQAQLGVRLARCSKRDTNALETGPPGVEFLQAPIVCPTIPDPGIPTFISAPIRWNRIDLDHVGDCVAGRYRAGRAGAANVTLSALLSGALCYSHGRVTD